MNKVEEVLQDIKAFINAQTEDLSNDEKEQVLTSTIGDLQLELKNMWARQAKERK